MVDHRQVVRDRPAANITGRAILLAVLVVVVFWLPTIAAIVWAWRHLR